MKQEFEKYTAEDLRVWSTLFKRQKENLKDKASIDYLNSLEEMKEVINEHELPCFEKINQWFKQRTGWEIECVPGLIEMEEFFILLSQKKFPSSTWLRTMDKLDYLEEPDMFHDIFGHIPLLSNPLYSDFIQKFGELGLSLLEDKAKLKMLQRLYWFSIEFGLIEENNRLKIYGAGIISSFGESNSSLNSKINQHLNFVIDQVIDTDFCTSEIQDKYFVIPDLITLLESINVLKEKWIGSSIPSEIK